MTAHPNAAPLSRPFLVLKLTILTKSYNKQNGFVKDDCQDSSVTEV